jgi:hypothetical protein
MSSDKTIKVTKTDGKPIKNIVVVTPEQRAAVFRTAMKNSSVKVHRKRGTQSGATTAK